MFEATHYSIPKAQSFFQATTTTPRAAWEKILHVLTTLTDDTVLGWNIALSVERPGDRLPVAIAASCLDEARCLFGPEDEPGEAHKKWSIKPPDLDRAIAFALSDDRWPRQKDGPIRLVFSYKFNWRGFPDKLPDPLASWQNGTCLFILIFERRRLQIAPSLVFPAPYESAACREFIAQLRTAVPFDLDVRNFRRMLVNPKNGATRHLHLTPGSAKPAAAPVDVGDD